MAPAAFALTPVWGQEDPIHPTNGIIYEDNFDGFGAPLNGRVVDVVNGIAWEAGSVFWDNGQVDSSTTHHAATLPFNPVAGVEYTAEATILNPNSDWIAFGFRSEGEDWTRTGNAMRHNTGGYAWILSRHSSGVNQEAFIGPGATSLAFRLSLDGTVPIDFKIVLNTFESIWRVEYFVNGDSQGVYPLATSAVESIRGIGFSRTSGAAGATGGIVSNFRVSASTTPTIPATPPRPSAETGIVYQHDFSGSGGPLNGVPLDAGDAAWEAGDLFRDNGAVEPLVSASASGQAAWLPFEPGANGIYTAEATVTNPGGGWIAFGFLRENPAAVAEWTETNAGVRHANGGGFAWMLTRTASGAPVQQIFNGPDAAGNVFTGDATGGDPNGPVQMKIVLNTMGEEWTASYFINGEKIGETSTLPNLALDRSGSGIGGIAFSRSNISTAGESGTISAFRLSGVSGELLLEFKIVDADFDFSAGTASLSWGSVEGASYRVEMSENLVDWETVAEGIEATGETTVYEAAELDLSGDRKFFRVALEL